MTTFVWSNFFSTTLSAAVASGDTTINVASATNAPTISAGQQWAIIVQSASTPSSREVMYVTAISSDAFTVTRGQEGTAAGTWAVGDYVIGGNTEGVMGALGQLAATQTWSGQNTFDGTGSGNAVTVSDTSNTGGVNIKLVGNGSSTPSKTVRVVNGAYQVLNDAYTTVLLLLDDTGNLTMAGTASVAPATASGDAVNLGQFATPGMAAYDSAGSYSWTVPANVHYVKAYVTGGGGGGAGTLNSQSGGGGGAGGTAIAIIAVTPGTVMPIVVGIGGAASTGGGGGGAGASSTFSSLAGGGGAGGNNSSGTASSSGGAGGTASGGTFNVPGGDGGDGQPNILTNAYEYVAGNGGTSYWGGGGKAGQNGGIAGSAPGSGGGGAYTTGSAYNGAAGAAGCVILEWWPAP